MARRPVTTLASPRGGLARAYWLDRLRTDSAALGFFPLMRLLHRLYPTRAPVGEWADPSTEVARFQVPPGLAFPPGEVARVTLGDAPGAPPALVDVWFLGLTGPQGVLPHVYTQHVADRVRERDTAMRAFLDLFHHRVLSLFFRAWERHRPALAAERGGEDRFRSHLLDLIGVGTEAVQQRSPIPTALLAAFAGLLALRTRPAVGLAHLVGEYFGVEATVDQFVGDWQPLRRGGQCRLDDGGDDGRLGRAVLGDAVFDPHAALRLRLGPLTRAQFDGFLPGGRHHARLRDLVRVYTEGDVTVQVQLVLARAEVPAAAIGTRGAPALGYGSWIRRRPPDRDRDDVSLALT